MKIESNLYCSRCGTAAVAWYSFDDQFAHCPECGHEWDLPELHWDELLMRIGLEAMYSMTLETALRAGMAMPDRRTWLTQPAATFLTPLYIVRALQAGIPLNVAPLVNPAQPPARRVLQS